MFLVGLLHICVQWRILIKLRFKRKWIVSWHWGFKTYTSCLGSEWIVGWILNIKCELNDCPLPIGVNKLLDFKERLCVFYLPTKSGFFFLKFFSQTLCFITCCFLVWKVCKQTCNDKQLCFESKKKLLICSLGKPSLSI